MRSIISIACIHSTTMLFNAGLRRQGLFLIDLFCCFVKYVDVLFQKTCLHQLLYLPHRMAYWVIPLDSHRESEEDWSHSTCVSEAEAETREKRKWAKNENGHEMNATIDK
jgi:hypothetical protein